MRNKHLIYVLCLRLVFVFGGRLQIAEHIITYFHSRNIVMLNIFICEEKDNFLLRKTDNFSNFLAVIYFNRVVKWDGVKKNSGWFVDSSCNSNRNIFKSIPKNMLGEGFFWLIRGVIDDCRATLEQMDLGLSTDLVVADDNGTYYDVYRVNSKSELKVKQFELPRVISKRNRYNLEGYTLCGSLVLKSLELNNRTRDLIIDKYYYPQTEVLNRKNYMNFLHLSHLFNFKLEVIVSDSFGYKTSNGTFDGQIRDIILKKVDFGMSPVGFTHERLSVVDYTANMDQILFLIIFMEEKSFGGYMALCYPFTSRVWIGIFILTAVSIVVTVLSQLPMNSHFRIVDGCLNLISILSSQGFSYEFIGYRTKFLSIVLLLFGMIISTFYHTSIMDGLLSPTPISIKTIQDVLDNKKIGLAKIPYLTPLFFHPLVSKKIKESHSETYEVQMGIKKLQQDKTFSIVGDEHTMHVLLQDSLTDTEKCSEREITMSTITLSHVIEKNSHYREMIIQGEFLLIERGIEYRERKHWYPDSPKCLLSSSFVTVSVESIFIGLIIYFIGFITSIITVAIEILIDKKLSNTLTRPS